MTDQRDNIEVMCICFPNGTNMWLEIEPGEDHYAVLHNVMDKWKAENPEYVGSGCTGGFVLVRMPRKDYHAIPRNDGLSAYLIATHSEEARTACGDEASVANEESRT